MLIAEPLRFIKEFRKELNTAIKAHCPEKHLSRIKQYWLSFCVMAIMVTNTVYWARFQRASIGRYRIGALSWMFRKSKIPWDLLLQMSVDATVRRYGISEGNIGIDDTEKSAPNRPAGFFKFIRSRISQVAAISLDRALCFWF